MPIMMTQGEKQRYDIVIVGAGPAGLETALQAEKAGFSYLLLDKDDAGALIKNTMGNKKFFHEYGRNTAKPTGLLPFPDRLLGDELVELWRTRAKSLNFKKGLDVVGVRKTDGGFVVKTAQGEYGARFVVLASGTFEHSRELGVPGEKGHPNVHYFIDYYNDYFGKKVLVIGGGNSAVETACYLAPDNEIVHIVRGKMLSSSVTEKNRRDHEELVAEGKIRTVFEGVVEEIFERAARVSHKGNASEYPFDLMFIHIGFLQPFEFLASVGVGISHGKPIFSPETFESDVSGLYIAGALTGADSVIESANQAVSIVGHLQRSAH